MKELYTTPAVEMDMFEAVDVIRTSTTNPTSEQPITLPKED